ncbi:MAG: hypothetical protein Q9195_001975 [Heterodermia aff. obscurata]
MSLPPDLVKSQPLRRQLSKLAFSDDSNGDSLLLQKLPLELRILIYSHVIGNDRFRLITRPWKVVAAPDIDGNLSMTQEHFKLTNPVFRTKPFPSNGTALLMTCRQVYSEAVDLLYSSNTFVLHDFHTLETFAKSIPPQRLNAIRELDIFYSPVASIPYQHESTAHYDLPPDLDWIWEIVTGMQGLRNLGIFLEAYSTLIVDDEDREACEVRRLKPLLQLGGLSTFRLELTYIGDVRLEDQQRRMEPYAPALRRAIIDNATKPKNR